MNCNWALFRRDYFIFFFFTELFLEYLLDFSYISCRIHERTVRTSQSGFFHVHSVCRVLTLYIKKINACTFLSSITSAHHIFQCFSLIRRRSGVNICLFSWGKKKEMLFHLNWACLIRFCAEADDLSDSYQSGTEENGLGSKANKEINGNWVPPPVGTVHEARLKAKAKRRLRKNSSRDSGRGDSLSENGDVSPASPKGKVLDRRSRLGKGRGLPKKGVRRVPPPWLHYAFVSRQREISEVCLHVIFRKAR